MATIRLREWATSAGLDLGRGTVQGIRSQLKASVQPSAQPGPSGSVLWDVTPGNVVGTLQIGQDRVLVRPKLDVAQLLHLIAASRHVDAWRPDAVDGESQGDLSAALASLYARVVADVLAAGVLRGYRRHEDDLVTVRGRIDLARQLRSRPGLGLPLALSFDTHDEDVLENRLLLAAALAVRPLVAHVPGVTRRLHGITTALAEVSVTSFPAHAVPAVIWTRLNERYRPAVELARLILKSTSVQLDAGTHRMRALTVDMSQVFEDYLATTLGDALKRHGGVVLPQHLQRLDVDGFVPIKPDLVWYREPNRPGAVIDAKYKNTAGGGVPESDVYQMLAYCTALRPAEGHLVYAKGETAELRIRVAHDGPTIHIHALDLTLEPAALGESVRRLAGVIAGSA